EPTVARPVPPACGGRVRPPDAVLRLPGRNQRRRRLGLRRAVGRPYLRQGGSLRGPPARLVRGGGPHLPVGLGPPPSEPAGGQPCPRGGRPPSRKRPRP